jgi:hypothetical protein
MNRAKGDRQALQFDVCFGGEPNKNVNTSNKNKTDFRQAKPLNKVYK